MLPNYLYNLHIYRTRLYTAIVNIYKKQASSKYTLRIYLVYAYNI